MINYILQVMLFQVLFLAIYDFLLSKETFFNTNRGYLLSTPILSFMIPLIKIQSFQKIVSQEFINQLPEVVLSPENVIQQTAWYQSIQYIEVLFWLGAVIFIAFFLVKLFRLLRLIITSTIEKKRDFTLVFVKNQKTAFSFFNYVFLGKEISETQQQKVIAHELVHSQQKHSLDLLFFEVLKIVMWFNPMIYMYQKRITLLHEYISDAVVVKSATKETYINNLLSSLFQVENISFVNQFYKQSLIKQRIIMMTKTQSQKMNQLKYLLLIPVLASMLLYISCVDNGKSTKTEEVLVIEEVIEIEEVLEEESIAFMKLDKAPTFPGCEDGDKDCFQKEIQKHFFKNFNSQIANQLGLKSGKNRMIMLFKIDKQGNVADIKVKAPHKDLEAEATRVIKALPIMTPGEHDGKTVNVKYTLPIRIDIQ